MAAVVYNEDNSTWSDEDGYEYSWVVIARGIDSTPWAFANSFGRALASAAEPIEKGHRLILIGTPAGEWIKIDAENVTLGTEEAGVDE